MTPFPNLAGPNTVTFPPNQPSSPISIQYARSSPAWRSSSSTLYVAAYRLTSGPNRTRVPMVTRAESRILRLTLALKEPRRVVLVPWA